MSERASVVSDLAKTVFQLHGAEHGPLRRTAAPPLSPSRVVSARNAGHCHCSS